MIKKEAKPCPQCGEFISKVSGCDQMFCIKCSCAFSYNTGIIEKGIIHNPLAYDYFQKNPDAQEAYLNRIRGGGETENGNCRTPIPSLHHIQPFIILGQPNFLFNKFSANPQFGGKYSLTNLDSIIVPVQENTIYRYVLHFILLIFFKKVVYLLLWLIM